MCGLRILPVVFALGACPFIAAGQLSPGEEAVVDRVVAQEQSEVQLIRQYSPLVETYIQYFRLDKRSEAVPDGDKYFLGRAELAKGVVLEELENGTGLKSKLSENWREFVSLAFVPGGFLQMIYVDT